MGMCQENRFIPAEFDGNNDAMLSPYTQDGEPHIEYLRYDGVYEDVPLEKIRKQMLAYEYIKE